MCIYIYICGPIGTFYSLRTESDLLSFRVVPIIFRCISRAMFTLFTMFALVVTDFIFICFVNV
jgi:hypothetical protein